MKSEDQAIYETGKRPRLQPRTLRKLAEALNVLPRELMVRR
jgi:hypothetical protein